jgi:hypothetical protein
MSLVILSACGKGNESSSGASAQAVSATPTPTPISNQVIGQDISGTYVNTGIFCINPAGAVVASATYTSGSVTETLYINGNSIIVNYAMPTCSVTENGTIQLTKDSDLSGGNTGTFTQKINSIFLSGGVSSCNVSLTLNPVTGSAAFDIKSYSSTFTHQENLNQTINGTYLYTNNKIYSVFSTETVTGQPNDACWIIYEPVH